MGRKKKGNGQIILVKFVVETVWLSVFFEVIGSVRSDTVCKQPMAMLFTVKIMTLLKIVL